MKFNTLYAIALVSASFTAQAAPISDLHSTGVGFSGGTQDTNYTVTDTNGVTGFGYSTDGDSGYPVGYPWLGDTSSSAWLTPANNPSGDYAVGNFGWRTTFDLTGFDAASASFNGRFAADNSAIAYLNGYQIGTSDGFSNWSNFASQPGFFLAGINTVDFTVFNGGGPTGLLVEISDSSEVANVVAVPEPETYAMLLAGLSALGVVARRRKSL